MTVLLYICFSLSAVIFLFSALCALNTAAKRHNQSVAYKELCFGVLISAVCYFVPFYEDYFSEYSFNVFLKSVFLSVHHAIRLFVVDVNYDELRVFADQFGLLGDFYTGFGILLFLVAPALTFTFIVSFLQEVSTVCYIWFSSRTDYYIFSEFNLQSFYLAQDIREKYPRVNIVFLGIDRENKREYEKIKAVTRDIHPALLPTDCIQMNEMMARYKRNAKFFIIGEKEEENSATAIAILDRTPHKSTREIYIRLRQSDRLLDNLPTYENTQVFRIEHVYSLVMHNLEQLGTRLFDGAKPDGSGDKVISLLVIGLGRTGSELVRNLAWFTQVEGYTTRIHAFEQDRTAIEKFKHRCPGLLGVDTADRHCEIIIHSDMIFGTPDFDRELENLGGLGFVFVTLGSDSLNINAALEIRKTLAGMDQSPPIQAVVRNANVSELISDSKNYRGASYNIEFFGSFQDIYCLDFITDAKNKEAIIRDHLKWLSAEDTREYLSHESRYRMAKAWRLHQQLLENFSLSEEERARSAHRQWTNQLFSEGYRYGPVRNDIAKHHPELVAYDSLQRNLQYR